VGLIFDLAVVGLALAVIGSLGLLAWTFGVTAVRGVHRSRRRVAELRRQAADVEDQLRAAALRYGDRSDS
jgi:hypothetical protein